MLVINAEHQLIISNELNLTILSKISLPVLCNSHFHRWKRDITRVLPSSGRFWNYLVS